MTRWLDEREQRVWRSWVLASTRLEAHLARRMQADGDISMSDFAVLVQLSEAPGGRLRAFALGRALQWEKSRLSKHLARMTARGLVARRDCADDRRGAFVEITEAGRAAIRAAAPDHAALVKDVFFGGLTRDQAEELGRVCRTVLQRLGPDA